MNPTLALEAAPPPPLDWIADWRARRYRAGHDFELVSFDRLPPAEQAAFAELAQAPGFYGLLRPRPGSGRTWKAADRDLALLWLTLSEPGLLPFFVVAEAAPTLEEDIEGLVLEGVLEVETAASFVSGAAALGLYERARAAAPPGRLAELSLEALRYGAALGELPLDELIGRLYGYHREPLRPDLERSLADEEALLAFLGAGPGTPLARQLARDWRRAERAEEAGGWLLWAARSEEAATTPHGTTFKLYVSPPLASLPGAFAVVAEVLARSRARAFKVGADAAGLARPDKLVAYFGRLEELEAAAADLAPRLAGVPAQGVPFTAEIAHGGLLSWGVDPPRAEQALSWLGPESWRLWVVRRLGAALVAARGEAGPEAWRYALERLHREGVDVERWTPSAALWRDRPA
jgi:hypothetical protein